MNSEILERYEQVKAEYGILFSVADNTVYCYAIGDVAEPVQSEVDANRADWIEVIGLLEPPLPKAIMDNVSGLDAGDDVDFDRNDYAAMLVAFARAHGVKIRLEDGCIIQDKELPRYLDELFHDAQPEIIEFLKRPIVIDRLSS
ncbi:MAG: hypothetical protein AAFX02_03815 [Pseudomonadota bacterium]